MGQEVRIEMTDSEEAGLAKLEAAARNTAQGIDVHDYLRNLRHSDPIHFGDINAELNAPNFKYGHAPCSPIISLYRYKDCTEVLRNNEVFSSQFNASREQPDSLICLDPPRHNEVRRVTQKALFPRPNINEWRKSLIQPSIESYVKELIANQRADLWRELLIRFPVTLTYRLIGIDEERAERMYAQGLHWTELTEEANAQLYGEFQELIDRKLADHEKGDGGDDMVSLIISANSESGVLSTQDIVNLLHLLLPAGAETTARSGASMLINLLQRPELVETLQENRSLIPAAVEEAMRFDGPVVAVFRAAMEDYQLGEVTIPAGAGIQPVVASANRDEAIFENPDDFDIERGHTSPSLGFGYGPHLCIGHYVARTEMEVLLEVLLDYLPKIRLEESAEPAYMMGLNLRTPNHVKVRWD
jgi:cytochrome P450